MTTLPTPPPPSGINGGSAITGIVVALATAASIKYGGSESAWEQVLNIVAVGAIGFASHLAEQWFTKPKVSK